MTRTAAPPHRRTAAPPHRRTPMPDSRPRIRIRAWFLRAMGLVYLCAFHSLDIQMAGLFGPDGLAPIAATMERASEALGNHAVHRIPTVFWLSAEPTAVRLLPKVGTLVAAALTLGLFPFLTSLAAWVLYLSVVTVGAPFLSYQWDILLLEAGFLTILWAPRSFTAGAHSSRRPARLITFALWWLLFRLMFFSGWVKLASQDPAWWDLTALTLHYETQPLPTWTAWYAHQLPGIAQRAACGIMFVIELALPFFILFGRTARAIAFPGLVLLQIAIAATGNYGFFNLLTAVLCLPLLDDDHLTRIRLRFRGEAEEPPRHRKPGPLSTALRATAVLLILAQTIPASWQRLTQREMPGATHVEPWISWATPFRLTGSYGLFAVMTKNRPEVIVEGSRNGRDWKPYVFRWKPGPLDRRPAFVWPPGHMPRLDWQLWFDGLYLERMIQTGRRGYRVVTPSLIRRLRDGSPAVSGLLANDPFGKKPPTFLRWHLYDYRFTDERTGGAWWKREHRYTPDR